MQPRRYARENWTALSFGFAAHRHHILKHLAGFPDVENSLRFLSRQIDPDFLHYYNGERIEDARF